MYNIIGMCTVYCVYALLASRVYETRIYTILLYCIRRCACSNENLSNRFVLMGLYSDGSVLLYFVLIRWSDRYVYKNRYKIGTVCVCALANTHYTFSYYIVIII